MAGIVPTFQFWKENIVGSDWLGMGDDALYHEYQADVRAGIFDSK